MKKKIGVLYIVLLHLLIVVILLNPDLTNRIYLKLGILEPGEVEMAAYYRKMSLYHSIIDKNLPEGAVLFIGDSHIQMLSVSAVTDRAVNYGISGDTTAGILKRLPVYESIKRAKAVVLVAGHNDIKQKVAMKNIIGNYKRIFKQMPDSLPVLFASVLPVDERIATELTGANSRIRSLNTSSKRICGEFSNCHFLDFGEKFVDESGNLAADYHNGKGAHLSAKGYSLWIRLVKNALLQYVDRPARG